MLGVGRRPTSLPNIIIEVKPLQINQKRPVVTYTLAAINGLMFLVELALEYLPIELPRLWLLSGSFGDRATQVLYLLGAKEVISITLGEWWRLLAPMVLHSGIQHVLFNTMALVIWGRQAEVLLGRIRFLAVYLLAGLGGSIASYAFSTSLSVGASGAIFGIFGAFLYFRLRHREIFNRVFGVQVLVIVALNLASGFMNPVIDNWGHIGGLVGGFIASAITGLFGERRLTLARIGALVGYAVLFGGIFALGFMCYSTKLGLG